MYFAAYFLAVAIGSGLWTAPALADDFAKLYAPGLKGLTAWLISSGPDGESHLKQITLSAGEHDFFGVPNGLKAYVNEHPESLQIFSAPGNIDLPWHTTQRKEMFIMLRGSSTMVLGDGTRKTFHAGDITIFEDSVGRGHSGRTGPEGYTVINLDLGPAPSPAGGKP